MPDLLRSYDVAFYHSEFYGRMVRDVGREIDWQRTHSNELAGNMLCALALVVYTEVLGGLAEGQLERRRTTNAEAFHSFLRRMAGGRYDDFRKGWETARGLRLYDVLRNGLVHEYAPKVGTRVWFIFEEEDATLGLSETPDYALALNIRPYFEDFRKAGDELFKQLSVAAVRREQGSV